MKVPAVDQLEEVVFTNPPNPRAVSNFFGALLDAGVEAGLAGRAASALGHVYTSGLVIVRALVADRGANALLYDESFRESLREQLLDLERQTQEIPGIASQLMDRLEQRSAEPEDKGRVRAWVTTLRQLAAQFSVESLLDLPMEAASGPPPSGGGHDSTGDAPPFGPGAVARLFRSLVVVSGLVELLGEEEIPAGMSAGALSEVFREVGSRLRPAILGDGRGWQGLVHYLNDFSSGDQLPRT